MMALPRARRVTTLVALLLLLVFAGEVAFVLSLPLPEQVNPVPDDSFFYLRIAQEFWRSGLFTFDGRNETYGFHPLWQLLMIALQPLFPDPVRFFHAALVVCCALHVAAGAALLRLCQRLGGPWAAGLVALLWLANPAVMVWCWSIKENGLHALLWALALTEVLALLQADPGRGRGARLGLWFGLLLLARINALLEIGAALAVLLLPGPGHQRRARLRAAVIAVAVMVVTATPWYLYAWLHFGEAMPSSGTWKLLMMRGHVELGLKLHWLHLDHFAHALAATPGYLRFLVGHGFGRFENAMLLLLPLGIVALWRRREALRPGACWLLLGVLTAALVSAAANVLMLEIYLRYTDWYAVAEFVAIAIVAAVLGSCVLQWLRRPWPRLAAAALLTAAALLPHQGSLDARLRLDLLRQPPRQVQLLEMGLWLRRHLPPDTAVGLWDPGIVSYFRGGLSISCDPLMNSDDYVARFAADPFGFPSTYVREQQMAYMVGASVIDQPTAFPALPQRPGSREPTCEVLWQPYPDDELGWSEPRWFLLVRPTAATAPATLREQDFTFGVLYPDDPARRRVLTGDRDRLLAGLDWQADVLRLQLQLGAGATAELRVDGELQRRFDEGANGWQYLDARAFRGHRLQLQLHDAEAAAVPQAQIVDYSLRD